MRVGTALLLGLAASGVGAAERDDEYETVTCGSVVEMVHVATGYSLHSHQINWGSGSAQQSVTASKADRDQNNLWVVKGPTGEKPCRVGEPIKCSSQVRLEHLATAKNLHSHNYRAPLSGNQEVTGFGEMGVGDQSDDWKLVCSAKPEKTGGYWRRSQDVKLKHAATGRYLTTSQAAEFNQQNCRNCPIKGQMEVSAGASSSQSNHYWYADQGVFFPPHDDAPASSKDEL